MSERSAWIGRRDVEVLEEEEEEEEDDDGEGEGLLERETVATW